ncbi:MAG: type I methionyl aminopeptidase [Methylacidiphilales bacterium]|nr:type I methionyl aminopeptidase [Candidatus Methylacidiphilales bacterium]MDW8348968.1 type I methionyl aminopeptidase [Verrucomicrobiae bacterium]
MAQIPIKREPEIQAMRESGALAATILEQLKNLLAPGVTTREIDQAAADLMREYGVKSAFYGYRKFPGHICIGINEEVVHGIGSSRRIQYGDIVKIDVGILHNGWIGDTAATIPIGEISADIARLITATEEALYHGIAAARAGARVGDISHSIESYIKKHRFSVVREFVGHGVGRHIHEEPQVPNFGQPHTGPILKPGMTLAIEPMVNLGTPDVRILADGWTAVTRDGLPSAHFEHTIVITEKEAEILTCLPTQKISKSKAPSLKS